MRMQEAKIIVAFIDLFELVFPDKDTLEELRILALDQTAWQDAHALFSSIRNKTLQADESKNDSLQMQYSFQEICAKTLYNLYYEEKSTTARHGPFDADSPFWVVPNAFRTARFFGIELQRVVDIVCPPKAGTPPPK